MKTPRLKKIDSLVFTTLFDAAAKHYFKICEEGSWFPGRVLISEGREVLVSERGLAVRGGGSIAVRGGGSLAVRGEGDPGVRGVGSWCPGSGVLVSEEGFLVSKGGVLGV